MLSLLKKTSVRFTLVSLTYIVSSIVLVSILILNKDYVFSELLVDKSKVLVACKTKISTGGHTPSSKFHYHPHITIIQDSKLIEIPANLGIVGDCIHPIHTHDRSGSIHIDYPKQIQFTLRDFFNVMGQVFTDEQIGRLKVADGYTIHVLVDGKRISKNVSQIILKDGQNIEIIIQSPQQ